jgi:ABC-2 type transport system ATP-binding protein
MTRSSSLSSLRSVTAAVEVKGVRKQYGALVAVEDLTLTIDAGQILGVLGPNGAGKTTAIRVLTTILTPTRGTFAVAGVPHTRPAEIRRRIGVLPESAGYPEQQSGDEFLRYHARLYGHDVASARAVSRTLLAEVGLEDRSRSLIAGYSRGMRQRLGIARALVNDPEVVFLDEPTLGLDPAGQRQVLDLVREVARSRGATVVLSTHMLHEVEESCTSVLILGNGRALASGPISEVLRTVTVQHRARLRVPIDHVDQARAALAGVAGLTLEPGDGRPDVLTISVTAGAADRRHQADDAMNAALTAVLVAGVPILGFEVEGSRLSAAFLAMTERSEVLS